MNIVVATCKNRGIGIKNSLPWRLLADTYFFKYLTLGNEKNAVIMGKNTYLSLPKPLKHRDNIVLSTTINPKKYNIYSASSMIQVIPHLYKYENVYFFKGVFPETANSILDKKFCFVHLDTNLYQSTLDSLEFFWPRMVKGGRIVSHDYKANSMPGITKAFQEFFKNEPERIIEIADSQAMVVK